ncbi:50S ribosomal protein L18 [uncultured archaeon]|nr:50S ribosomal protein L18 [uncultured archaeon]
MKLDKRRRVENKTNYRKRLVLLKGRDPRLVIRKTNRYIIMQIIESNDAQDKILYSVNTRDLLKNGWPKDKEGSLKSLPAAYLTGLLLGKKAKALKDRVILDTGLIPNTKGSKIYAAVKGISDAGIQINYNEEVIPSKERLEGKNTKVADIFSKIKEKIK